jgi:hypothetical protein
MDDLEYCGLISRFVRGPNAKQPTTYDLPCRLQFNSRDSVDDDCLQKTVEQWCVYRLVCLQGLTSRFCAALKVFIQVGVFTVTNRHYFLN